MKNFKKIPLVLTLLNFLSVSSLLGQGWEKIYTDSIGQYSNAMITPTDDGGCIVFYGFRFSSPIQSHSILAYFDSEGKSLWTKSFESTDNTYDFRITPDNNYIVVNKSEVIKINSEGDTIYNRNLSFPPLQVYQSFVAEVHQTNQNETIILANQSLYPTPFIIYDNGIDTIQNFVKVDTSELKFYFKASKLTLDNNIILLCS